MTSNGVPSARVGIGGIPAYSAAWIIPEWRNTRVRYSYGVDHPPLLFSGNSQRKRLVAAADPFHRRHRHSPRQALPRMRQSRRHPQGRLRFQQRLRRGGADAVRRLAALTFAGMRGIVRCHTPAYMPAIGMACSGRGWAGLFRNQGPVSPQGPPHPVRHATGRQSVDLRPSPSGQRDRPRLPDGRVGHGSSFPALALVDPGGKGNRSGVSGCHAALVVMCIFTWMSAKGQRSAPA